MGAAIDLDPLRSQLPCKRAGDEPREYVRHEQDDIDVLALHPSAKQRAHVSPDSAAIVKKI
jgi:hypothetical protein